MWPPSIAVIIPIALFLPQVVVTKCLHSLVGQDCLPNDDKFSILIPDDSTESKETKRVNSYEDDDDDDDDDEVSKPKYAIISGNNGNLVLINLAEQWSIAKHAIGHDGKFEGIMVENTDLPLKYILKLTNKFVPYSATKKRSSIKSVESKTRPEKSKKSSHILKPIKDVIKKNSLSRNGWGSPGSGNVWG